MEKFYPLKIDTKTFLNLNNYSLDEHLKRIEKEIKVILINNLDQPPESLVKNIISLSKINEN